MRVIGLIHRQRHPGPPGRRKFFRMRPGQLDFGSQPEERPGRGIGPSEEQIRPALGFSVELQKIPRPPFGIEDMFERPGVIGQVSVDHMKTCVGAEWKLCDPVVERVSCAYRGRVFNDVPDLKVKHEGFHVLSHQDEDAFVIGAVPQLVGPVILGVQVLILAGRHPEIERQGNRRHGSELEASPAISEAYRPD